MGETTGYCDTVDRVNRVEVEVKNKAGFSKVAYTTNSMINNNYFVININLFIHAVTDYTEVQSNPTEPQSHPTEPQSNPTKELIGWILFAITPIIYLVITIGIIISIYVMRYI